MKNTIANNGVVLFHSNKIESDDFIFRILGIHRRIRTLVVCFGFIDLFSYLYFDTNDISPITIRKNGEKPALITHSRVITVIVFMSLVAFLIRLLQPIGTAVLNMQLCYFSQYIILFSLGVITYRRDLLTHLPSRFGKFWFRLALYLGIPLWGLLMVFGRAVTEWTLFAGGIHWQAVAYAIWESFFCIGVCLGLLVLFHDKYNTNDTDITSDLFLF